MSNQKYKVRHQIVNVNGDDPVFLPHSLKTSKCSGSCNGINNPCAKLCVPGVIKNVSIKMFNLVPGTNETRLTEWHETCKYKCRFNSSVCINKQRWNDDKCSCECKELKFMHKNSCVKGFIWNSSNYECECCKSLDDKICKYKKTLVDKLVEEWNIEETRLVEITSAKNENKHKCSSCTLYIVSFSMFFTINVGIAIYFFYFHWYLKRDATI